MTTMNCKNCHSPLKPEQMDKPCPHCGSVDRELTVQDYAVFSEKARVAKELAMKHYQVEPGLTQVIRFSGSPQVEATPVEPIKLLEINESTVPSGVMPLHFGPAVASGILFPSVIIEVTPEEYQRIRTQELKLPEGWRFEDVLPKPEGT
jgi:RNA polymerase subunit RPABC4/transcription elongation factor Spt4